MAIQIPNLGSGNGLTGDNELVIRQKYNANFTDVTHAASKLVGVLNGQLPLAQDAYKAAFSRVDRVVTSGINVEDCNNFPSGTRIFIRGTSVANSPPKVGSVELWLIETKYTYIGTASDECSQIATGYQDNRMMMRTRIFGAWKAWTPIGQSELTYDSTTASGANVVVDATGKLMRSTSSERYKDILGDLTLDDVTYANAMSLAPIVYRSTANADNPLHHYYSFSAEDIGALDKAFTLWRYTEQGTDEEGNAIEVPLAEPQAEGLNINAILAFNHAISVKQNDMMEKLEARIALLEK